MHEYELTKQYISVNGSGKVTLGDSYTLNTLILKRLKYNFYSLFF